MLNYEIKNRIINNLTREYAKKTEKGQKKLFQRLLQSPVMHTDCTCAKENEKNAQVFVCATPEEDTMYFPSRRKDMKG